MPAVDVVPYFTSGILIYYAQKYLKHFPIYAAFVKAMPGAEKWAHRAFALLASAVAAFGIHTTFEGSFEQGWHFAGTIPDGWTLLHSAWDLIKVFSFQQFVYDSAASKVLATHGGTPPTPPVGGV
jgi:hypothetical protein